MDDEPDTEAEIEAMRELERTGEWYDAATVSAEIAERARQEDELGTPLDARREGAHPGPSMSLASRPLGPMLLV